MHHLKVVKRWSLLIIILIILSLFFYFRLYEWLTFDALKENRAFLMEWTQQHYTLSILFFVLIYIMVVSTSVPGATILTLVGGFLFGPVVGSVMVVGGATLGAMLINLAVEFALRDWVKQRAFQGVKKMEAGLKEDAFSYLLFVRLVPLFPFWLVNIVPALLGVPRGVFFITTLIGIIPGTVVYVLVGNGLGHVLDNNQEPNLGIIFEPYLFIPLVALAVLALVPVAYKKFRKKKV